jgi:Ca2+-dependent lipid-binding protein
MLFKYRGKLFQYRVFLKDVSRTCMKVRTSHIHKHTSLTYIYGRVYTHTHMIIYVIVYMYIMSMSWLAFVTVFICFFSIISNCFIL